MTALPTFPWKWARAATSPRFGRVRTGSLHGPLAVSIATATLAELTIQ